jgi:hypothetical protein
MADPRTNDANVVHEQPTSKLRAAVDQILHFWPLLVVIAAGVVLIVNTLGEKYVTDIATRVHTELAINPQNVHLIKGDLTSLKAQLAEQQSNDVEIRAQLTTIETRLDTLIRIQLEGNTH